MDEETAPSEQADRQPGRRGSGNTGSLRKAVEFGTVRGYSLSSFAWTVQPMAYPSTPHQKNSCPQCGSRDSES